MSGDNRNLILALVLSAFVLFGWTFLTERYFPTAKPAATAPATPAASTPAAPTVAAPVTAPGQVAPAAVPVNAPLPAVLAATPRVAIETPSLRGSINLAGLRIDDLLLIRHTQAVDSKEAVRLFAPSGAIVHHDKLSDGTVTGRNANSNPNYGTNAAYFAGFGWAGAGAPPADARWTANGDKLTPQTPVTFSWAGANGLTFEVVLAVNDAYLFTVTQRVVNRGAAAVAFRPYGYVNRTGVGPEVNSFNLHVGPIAVLDGTLKEGEIDYDKLREDGPQKFASTGGWLGITDKFWLAALIPNQKTAIDANFTHGAGDRYQADFLAPAQVVAPGTVVASTTHLFAGAKEVAAVNAVRDGLGVKLFDRSIAWGWFWFIAQPIFFILDWLFKFTGNFGLAIVGLTLLVRLILFPIANRQYASMAKMKVFAPKMKELQEKYKDDKLKQQQEMMELYKREKINPLAGCLPILLQIPIFYALYKTLLISIEMRHQPLALWIKDLSAMDPLTPVNLFGLLPFTPPGILHIGLLTILLGVTMYIQFKLNPQPMDELQAKVFAWMPWLFMFMMAPFAAGLQLYWVVNNLVSIAQQWVLIRKYPSPAPAGAK
ncbi:membrane protein insertase YidC [Sandaracinobacteroides saxicola]|uniref:Membrane protein insertase YidC n=1 Tax=Sandaracinobacteroides saxicola TaxID=2759707 RepID=A0A7G5IIY2_9SPHN|nr:membrane protein insertase YidC [Sandaracinobacteroides saxicola]QMW23324.1 membrane protein insertase YidC [Sandaracinobacteroides saxicola]